MDITIQESPKVTQGDLVFIDDLHRGRKFQVVGFNGRQVVKGKEYYYPVALMDLDRATIHEVYGTIDILQQFLDTLSYTVKKQEDYTIYLRRK